MLRPAATGRSASSAAPESRSATSSTADAPTANGPTANQPTPTAPKANGPRITAPFAATSTALDAAGFIEFGRDITLRPLETVAGPVLCAEDTYPLHYRHGRMTLDAPLLVPDDAWTRLVPAVKRFPMESAAFVDLETTGLSRGTGTYAFLIGVGRFIDGRFRIRQFFLRDFPDERAVLSALLSELESARALVTFNGRVFDWPLLETRATMNRMRLPRLPHLDLLHPARRLWRSLLGSCRLSSLEEHILDFGRTDDVPGADIPQMYFTFLETGDAEPLADVLVHNRLDILSLAALAGYMGHVAAAPLSAAPGGRPLSGEELMAVGKLLLEAVPHAEPGRGPGPAPEPPEHSRQPALPHGPQPPSGQAFRSTPGWPPKPTDGAPTQAASEQACEQVFEQVFEQAFEPMSVPAPTQASAARDSDAPFDEAVACLEEALNRPLSAELRRRTRQLLVTAYRRAGRIDDAVAVLHEAVHGDGHAPWAYIELAKHYEHRLGDYATAREWSMRALELALRRRTLRGLRSPTSSAPRVPTDAARPADQIGARSAQAAALGPRIGVAARGEKLADDEVNAIVHRLRRLDRRLRRAGEGRSERPKRRPS